LSKAHLNFYCWMNISEKIEAIRREPEHVRIWYVWVCVAISMFVVLILWFFSIASMFAEDKNNSSEKTAKIVPEIEQQLQTLKEQAPSLKDLNDQSLTAGSENTATAPQNTAGSQYSTGNSGTSGESQSGVYSNLSNVKVSQ